MNRILPAACAAALLLGTAHAAPFDADALHDRFVQAFNARDWAGVEALLADDIVFHRANASDVFVGRDAVLAHWSGLIGAPDQWNVKFAILDSDSSFTGSDGRVVERGDFAVTAGADDSGCYRGSYLMTWTAGDAPRLQMMAWQDVETDLANCK